MANEFLARLKTASLVRLTPEELTTLLEEAEVLREDNTMLAGMLRILGFGDLHLVQEETPDRDVLVRVRPTFADAEAFVEKRLLTYDKMWDG